MGRAKMDHAKMDHGKTELIKAGIMSDRRRTMRLGMALLLVAVVTAAPHHASGQTRIKDITDVEGVRDNQLIGYGIVAGLNNTGDQLLNAPFTRESLVSTLERLGVNIRDQEAALQTKDVAAVMVTANMPPFVKPGERIDVMVAALGDATNLTGGSLLVTSMLGADGNVHAVAQGPVATGAISARGQAQSITRGVPTSGRIANGAVVEAAIPFEMARMTNPTLELRNPDLTTAVRIAGAVNRAMGAGIAKATDPSTVVLNLQGLDVVASLARIQDLPVEPDNGAKVVIDEASGIIVMGANVVISTVAIAQGNLTIRVTETPQVAGGGPFSNTPAQVVPRTNISVDDQSDRKLGMLRRAVTLQELVRNMNALGVGPRDVISILQAIKASGALQADLEVR
jgi:flagellar P-ring protein precursor FlgI